MARKVTVEVELENEGIPDGRIAFIVWQALDRRFKGVKVGEAEEPAPSKPTPSVSTAKPPKAGKDDK